MTRSATGGAKERIQPTAPNQLDRTGTGCRTQTDANGGTDRAQPKLGHTLKQRGVDDVVRGSHGPAAHVAVEETCVG